MVDKFQIVFSGMEGSEPVRTEVRAWLTKLAPLTEGAGVTGGRISIQAAYQHRHGAGWRYQASLELTTATGVTVIPPECPGNNPSDDIYVAVRNVFRCVRRTLQEQQQDQQQAPAPQQATVRDQTPPTLSDADDATATTLVDGLTNVGALQLEGNLPAKVEIAES